MVLELEQHGKVLENIHFLAHYSLPMRLFTAGNA